MVREKSQRPNSMRGRSSRASGGRSIDGVLRKDIRSSLDSINNDNKPKSKRKLKPNKQQAPRLQRTSTSKDDEYPGLKRNPRTNSESSVSDLDRDESKGNFAGYTTYRPGSIEDRSKSVETKPPKKKRHSRKKKVLITIGVIFVMLVLLAGFAFYLLNGSTSKIFKGSLFGALQHERLDTDSFGRTNFLIYGTSEDNPGHGGAKLADSIMVVSLDQDTYKANVISIPRDLWVKYDMACSVGYEAKINTAYVCGLERSNEDVDQASQFFEKVVGNVIGTDIQYYAKVDYTVVRDVVDALGGVDIVIDSPDKRGILDRNFDKKCPNGPYTCYRVKYPNGPAHLDGKHALWLSRARNAKGGYGLPRANFDRERNQRKIMRAIQEKALSSGTLTNPKRALDILDSLGNNITTNIKTSQIQTLIDVAKHVKPDKIDDISLYKEDAPLVKTGNVGGQSVVVPTAGTYDYSQIQQKIREVFSKKPKSDQTNTSTGDKSPSSVSVAPSKY